jgi:hypothetical protein
MNVTQQPPGNDQARNAQSSGPQQQPQTLGLSEAARLLAQRRSALRQQPAPTGDEAPIGRAPAEEFADEAGDEAEALAGDEGEELEGQELQPDGEEQAEANEEITDDAILELDGEEIPLSQIKEWREGAMRQADYQRKTQALSQQQQGITELETNLNRFAHAINRDFQSRIEMASRALRPFAETDWAKLARENPAEYNGRKVQFEQAKSQLAAMQQHWQAFAQEYDGLSQQAIRMKAKAALPEIKQRIKGWNDALYSERMAFVKDTYRADVDTLSKVTDPWFWELANDAYLYRKGKQLPAQSKTKRILPKPVRGGQATPRQPSPAKALTQQARQLGPSARASERTAIGVQLLQQRRAAAQKATTRR